MDLFFWLSKLYEFIRIRFYRYPKFPLLNLPYVAMKQVIRSMSVSERIKLSQTSKRMRNYVILSRVVSEYCEVHIRDKYSFLYFSTLNAMFYCGRKLESSTNSEVLTNRDYGIWLNKKGTSLDNVTTIFQRTQSIFPSNYFSLVLYPIKILGADIQTILSIPCFQKCDHISVYCGFTVTSEFLDAVMDFASFKRDITIRCTNVSLDYCHEKNFETSISYHRPRIILKLSGKAFKFRDIIYGDSRWIHIDYLLSLENSRCVTLERCSLSSEDINILLKHWITSEFNMFKMLKIEFEEDRKGGVVRFCREVLFEGITVLRAVLRQNPCYLIATNSQNQLKRDILVCQFHDQILKMITESNDKIRLVTGINGTPCREVHKVLKLLDKKKELEMNVLDENSLQERHILHMQLETYGVCFKDNFAFLQ
ncbi:hypothetical protein GCK72_004443 [Caenorhabditis remanei]|uniref:F-box domain-containing protein n=1 Tax=Caenorhabditis remanei TaxID=31234 RepID=A0A6A5HB91_CAERE|nr:hypothetical protein GCK72_004443 [Caenorhabditis remanei]KAF1764495.1 hypothetical protein GCK72_004443 [Caenorhabditis remanei]